MKFLFCFCRLIEQALAKSKPLNENRLDLNNDLMVISIYIHSM